MPAEFPKPASAPSWINVTLIEKALAEEQGNDEEPSYVKVLTLSKATAPGENYSSTLFRATITLDNGHMRSLLVKIPPDGEAMARAVIQGGLFRFETTMLAKHVPAMQALLEQAAPGHFKPFAARCLLHGITPEPYLVLEDLSPQGFQVAERRRGLDLNQSRMALRSLARFHAASAALLKKDPSIANDYTNPLRENAPLFQSLVRSYFDLPAKVCKEWPGYEEYAESLANFAPIAMNTLADLHEPRPGSLNVLLHGDCWINNIMFKYENQKLSDIRMVDFQVSHIASPVLDFLYFLSTSLSEELTEDDEASLTHDYYSELSKTLLLLGQETPSFEQIEEDIRIHGAYAYFGALGVWPIVRTDNMTEIDCRVAGDASDSLRIYNNSYVRKHLQKVLPSYKRRGWILRSIQNN